MMLITPVFLGLGFAGNLVWGPSSVYFNSLSAAFTSIVLTAVGIVPVEDMYRQNPVWTAVFLLFAVLLCTFYIIGAFRGIYIDTKMQVRQELGYTSVSLTKEAVLWWVLDFLPVRGQLQVKRWWGSRSKRETLEILVGDEKKTSEIRDVTALE